MVVEKEIKRVKGKTLLVAASGRCRTENCVAAAPEHTLFSATWPSCQKIRNKQYQPLAMVIR